MEELQQAEILNKIIMMKQIVSGFVEIVEKENDALNVGDFETVRALYEQKIKTVAAYRSLSAFFIKNRAIVAAIETEDKEALKEVSQQLDVALKQNELLLKTRMEAGKKVMDTIINIVKTTNKTNATSYGSHGTYTPLDNNRNALAFNRTL